MSYQEELSKDIERRICRMELMVECGDMMPDERKKLEGEIYEREQTMDAMTDEH